MQTPNNKGLGARMLLAMLGGLASLVAGTDGHYRPDAQTSPKGNQRSRIGRGNYGKSLQRHFDEIRYTKVLAKRAARAA